MEAKNIALTPEGIRAIDALRHNCGTYAYYSDTLSRLFNYVLTQSDEIGMDDTEAVHTLRVLHSLKTDLSYIAGFDITSPSPDLAISEEGVFKRVEATFEDLHPITTVDQLDEPHEMLADVKRAWQKVNELQTIISEAITHAQNAGEKYEFVISDLADVNCDLETTAAALDAVMAIDPDTYEPKKLTETEAAAVFIKRSHVAITSGKELLDDALDHASRDNYKALAKMVSTARDLTVTAKKAVAELEVMVDELNCKNEL